MEWKIIITQLSLVVLLLGELAFADRKDVTLLDNKPVEEIAKILCGRHDGNLKLFSDLPTVTKLADYIFTSRDPKILECRAKYGESLLVADRLVKLGNGDICSDKKLSLIEEFHHKFISKQRRDIKEQEVNQRSVPSMLKVFFIHYVAFLGELCRMKSLSNLEKLSAADVSVREIFGGTSSHDSFTNLLDSFSQSFDFQLSEKNQKYTFLFWSLIDDLTYETKSGRNEFAKYVNSADDLAPGNNYRVTVKMGDPTHFRSAQDVCRKHLRPVYARSILPMLRFIELGFYYDYVGSIPDRWFKITQLCEIILPIRVVADGSLAEGQLELVPKSDTVLLIEASEEDPFTELADLASNSFTNPRLAHLVIDNTQEAKQIRKDIKGRRDVVRRVISRMAPRLRALTQAKKTSFFLGSQKGDSNKREDLSDAIGESLAQMSEPTPVERSKDKAVAVAMSLWSGLKHLSNQVGSLLKGPMAIVSGLLLYILFPERIYEKSKSH